MRQSSISSRLRNARLLILVPLGAAAAGALEARPNRSAALEVLLLLVAVGMVELPVLEVLLRARIIVALAAGFQIDLSLSLVGLARRSILVPTRPLGAVHLEAHADGGAALKVLLLLVAVGVVEHPGLDVLLGARILVARAARAQLGLPEAARLLVLVPDSPVGAFHVVAVAVGALDVLVLVAVLVEAAPVIMAAGVVFAALVAVVVAVRSQVTAEVAGTGLG